MLACHQSPSNASACLRRRGAEFMNGAGRSKFSVWRFLATGVAAAFGFVAPAAAQEPSPRLAPEAAPAAWVAYAETANRAVVIWLQDEAAAGVRLYLDRTRLAADQPAPPLELRLWIDDEGVVHRVEAASSNPPEVNAELKVAVEGHRLASPPPDMLQPLRLAIQLEPASTEAVEGDEGAGV